MRRKNREVSGFEEQLTILLRCGVCRVGFSGPDYPYIVPMNFGLLRKENGLSLYFHCAVEGEKLELLHRNPKVCFEADTGHNFIEVPPHYYTMEFESVMGRGTICVVEDAAERLDGLALLTEHYTGRQDRGFSGAVLAQTVVLRLDVESMTAKRLKYNG